MVVDWGGGAGAIWDFIQQRSVASIKMDLLFKFGWSRTFVFSVFVRFERNSRVAWARSGPRT
jgi:hypothetical protein